MLQSTFSVILIIYF